MSKRYFLVNKTVDNSEQKIALVGELFLKLDGLEAEISDNGGPVVIFAKDDVVTVRVEAEVKDLFFNSHPVKKGGLYFLESGDILVFKNSQIEVTSIDVPHDEPVLEMEKSSKNIATNTKLKNENGPSEDITFKVNKQHEVTRTSIDINELLSKAKSNKTNHKKYENNARKIQQKKISSADQITKSRPKKVQPLTHLKHKRSFKSELMAGPFSRLFAFISQVLLSITAKPIFSQYGLSSLTQEAQNFLSFVPPNILEKISKIVSIEALLPYILSFVILELISALVFASNFAQFLMGITTPGSFLVKRIKAITRTLISFITTPFLIFDLPILIGKMTLKEYLTRDCIVYRGKFFQYTSLLNITIFCAVAIFYKPLLTVIETQKFSYEMIERSSFDETQAKINGIFKTSKEVSDNFKVMGVSTPKLQYLLIHEKSSNFIKMSEYANINYSDLETVKSHIPLFSFFFPDLNKYLNKEEVDHVNLRKDVVNLFESGEILLTNDFFSIFDLNIFTMNTIYNFLKDRNLSPSSIKKINDFNRIYRIGEEKTFVTFTNREIKFLAVTSSYEDIESRVEQITIANIEQFKNPIDQAITGDSNLLSLEEYSKNIDTIKNIVVESKFMQSMSIYNSFLNSIIKNIPPEKEYIIEYLTSKKL